MSKDMNRRNFLRAAPAVGLSGLLVGAEAVAAVQLSRDEQIAHHKAELFRLLGETVPEGAVLTSAMVHIALGRNFDILQAKPAGSRSGYPLYQGDHAGGWDYIETSGGPRRRIGGAA